MIISLTPNTCIDHTLRVSSFELNKTIRSTGSAWGMGGKAADASWILGKLGIPSRALGFAAGPNGLRMQAMLQERGVETDFVWVQGETRLSTVLVVDGGGQSTITASSLKVSAGDVSELDARLRDALEPASCLVLGGSLPDGVAPEFYVEAIERARGQGVPVIFDASGPLLAAGLRAHPDLVKPNLAELGELLGHEPASQQEAYQAAREIQAEYGSDLIVTMGAQGALAVFGDRAYFIPPVSVPVLSAAGTGDGVLAGMALAYSRREPREVGLRHGFALAGAILQTLATADFELEEYQALLPQIRIEPFQG
jgi:1-phosphofructokinase